MRAHFSAFFQDEEWQQLVADIDDTVRTFVEQHDARKQLPNLKLRLAALKSEHLKVQLWKMKYALQQELERLEERLRLAPHDEELCRLLGHGVERWTDMWIMESLLQRVSSYSNDRNDLTRSSFNRKLPDPASSESSEPSQAARESQM